MCQGVNAEPMTDIEKAKANLPLPELIRHLGDELTPAPCDPEKFTIFSPLRDDGKNASFDVTRKSEGFVFFDHVLKVGGDEVRYVEMKLELLRKDAFKRYLEMAGVKSSTNGSKPFNKIVKTYDYTDELGNLLHQTVRFQPKGFRQRRPDPVGKLDQDGNPWTWSLKGSKTVLYNLLHLEDPARKGELVFIVEGEKDCDTLSDLGRLATTCPMGSGYWRPHFNEWLRGRDVIVIPDEDQAGLVHLEKLTKSLLPIVRSLCVIYLKEVWPDCPNKGDISDAVAAGVCDADALDEWVKSAHKRLQEPTDGDRASSSLNDTWNAERLARRLTGKARYVHQFGDWRLWDGKRWLRDEDGWVNRQAIASAKTIWDEVATTSDEKKREELIKWARQSGHESRLKSAINLARAMEGIASTINQFDADSMNLNCRNGIIDLTDGSIRYHQPDLLHSRMAEAQFVKGASCPTWEKFLHVVFDGNEPLIKFVQRCAGYSLTGSVAEQKLFFLFGAGRNGKSTFLETLGEIVADYGQRAPASLMLHDPKGTAIPTDMARLQGARFVAASEVEAGSRLAESRVKDLTGGDTIAARFMRQDFFEFKPTHKLWIAGNHKPNVRGDDLGIWRRIILIPFTVTIPEDTVDPELPHKLLAERDGILSWLVEGCLDWKAEGLNPPTLVRAAVKEYRKEEDLLGEFLSERCVEGGEFEVSRSELHAEYQVWANGEGIESRYQLTARTLSKQLRERGYGERKTHGTRVWEGIAIK